MKNKTAVISHWLPFVEMFSLAHAKGCELSSPQDCQTTTGSTLEKNSSVTSVSDGKGPLVVLCSPHPDDEILTATLPLRLLQEKKARVVNLIMTLGSDRCRKKGRLEELKEACALIGFEWRLAEEPLALEQVLPEEQMDSVRLQEMVGGLSQVFVDLEPDLVFMPHRRDRHPTHIGVHQLAEAAISYYTRQRGRALSVVETEYWQTMGSPNLMVGLGTHDLALLLAALVCHRGEVARNPYHLSLPARMMDNVRRGLEFSGGDGEVGGLVFAELYRLSLWGDAKKEEEPRQFQTVGAADTLELFT